MLAFLLTYAWAKDELLGKWNKFENEILYNNRFFVKDRILDEIKAMANEVAVPIPKDTILYRARIFDGTANKKLIERYNEILKEEGLASQQIKEGLFTDVTISIVQAADEDQIKEDLSLKHLKTALKKYNSDNFKGYNSEDSLPPIKGSVSGRVNPEGISYVYACEDEETPIYEIRPSIGQSVSLAKLKLKKDIKLFDFSKRLEHKNDEIINLFDIVCEKFSIPNYNDLNKYIPTQYIAEYVKQLDLCFDGIRFDSSLHKGGKNVVLFDREACSVMSTKILEINDIKIETQLPAICREIKSSKE